MTVGAEVLAVTPPVRQEKWRIRMDKAVGESSGRDMEVKFLEETAAGI